MSDLIVEVRNIDDLSMLKSFMLRNNLRVVRKPSSEMFGYAGLSVSKKEYSSWGIKMSPNTIWIDENLRGREYFRTLKHEVEELLLIKKGMKYFPAHKKATRDEVIQ